MEMWPVPASAEHDTRRRLRVLHRARRCSPAAAPPRKHGLAERWCGETTTKPSAAASNAGSRINRSFSVQWLVFINIIDCHSQIAQISQIQNKPARNSQWSPANLCNLRNLWITSFKNSLATIARLFFNKLKFPSGKLAQTVSLRGH